MNILVINAKLKQLVKTERKITYEILLLIQTLDVTKSYRELGYSSLFEYLTKEIGYSEGAAQRRISSARLIKECPKIEEDLKTGTLNLTQVSLAQVAIRQEERAESAKLSVQRKTEIVEKLRNKNTFETKKILKEELPAFEIPISKINPANNGKVHVTLEFDEKDWAEVQHLLARMSHKVPSQKLEDLLLFWQTQLKVKDQKSSQKAIKKNDQENAPKDQASQTLPPLRWWNRQYISIHTKRDLQRNSQNQCEYISKITGKRCESKHFLEVDHVIPLAAGGKDHSDNFRILCRAHNQQAAKDCQTVFLKSSKQNSRPKRQRGSAVSRRLKVSPPGSSFALSSKARYHFGLTWSTRMKFYLSSLLIILSTTSAFANSEHQRIVGSGRADPIPPAVIAGRNGGLHADLTAAIARRKGASYIQAGGLVVVKLLPDDRGGKRHQRFVVQMANGQLVTAIYNLDVCPRVPVAVGDVVALGGEFIWSQQRPLIHWLHHDPDGARPNGYVEHKGIRYCYQSK